MRSNEQNTAKPWRPQSHFVTAPSSAELKWCVCAACIRLRRFVGAALPLFPAFSGLICAATLHIHAYDVINGAATPLFMILAAVNEFRRRRRPATEEHLTGPI